MQEIPKSLKRVITVLEKCAGVKVKVNTPEEWKEHTSMVRRYGSELWNRLYYSGFAFYSPALKEINITPYTSPSTLIHEFGHYLEAETEEEATRRGEGEYRRLLRDPVCRSILEVFAPEVLKEEE